MGETPGAELLFLHYGEEWVRGSENCLLALVPRLAARGYRTRVVCNAAVLRDALSARGVDAVQLHLPEIMVDGPDVRLEVAGLLRTTRALVRLCDGRRPDLVYCNSGRAAQAAWLASRWLGVPRVAHLHAPFHRRYFWLWGLWDAAALVFASETTRATSLAPHRRTPPSHVVRNGVDLARFHPAVAREPEVRRALGLGADELVIGQIGSLIRRKGADVLLRAFATVRAARPARLVLAGDGPERGALQDLARSLGVADATVFAGEVERPERLLRSGFDVTVLAAREESLPLSLLEAAACGAAIVCTSVGGNGEVVVDERSGIVVPPDDAPALAGALLRMARDPALRTRLGAAARARAAAEFGVERYVDGVEAVIRERLAALSEGRRGARVLAPVRPRPRRG